MWSISSGRIQAKLGVNQNPFPSKTPVSFVVIDNQHLTEHGVQYFCALSKELVLVTTNREHPAFLVHESNLHIIVQEKLDLHTMLKTLKTDFGCERITVQTGGSLNEVFVREKLLDCVDIVVAPVLVGGKDTATLIDGQSLTSADDLSKLGVLQLSSYQVLQHSYIRLRYRVVG